MESIFLLASLLGPIDGLCVLVGDDRPETQRAAGAAAVGLDGALLLDVRLDTARARLPKCSAAAVVVGKPALAAARAVLLTIPIVTALVPAVETQLPRLAAVAPDADPAAAIDTLVALAPKVRRIGVVYDPAITGAFVQAASEAARSRGREIVALAAADLSTAIRSFHRFERELAIDALWILPDKTTTTRETAQQALELAHWRRIPVIGPSRWYVANGALFALEPRPEEHGKLAAVRVLDLLANRVAPALSYAAGASLLVSRRALDRLELVLPAAVLAQSPEVIQ